MKEIDTNEVAFELTQDELKEAAIEYVAARRPELFANGQQYEAYPFYVSYSVIPGYPTGFGVRVTVKRRC